MRIPLVIIETIIAKTTNRKAKQYFIVVILLLTSKTVFPCQQEFQHAVYLQGQSLQI
jgi:hypothetical protein